MTSRRPIDWDLLRSADRAETALLLFFPGIAAYSEQDAIALSTGALQSQAESSRPLRTVHYLDPHERPKNRALQ